MQTKKCKNQTLSPNLIPWPTDLAKLGNFNLFDGKVSKSQRYDFYAVGWQVALSGVCYSSPPCFLWLMNRDPREHHAIKLKNN